MLSPLSGCASFGRPVTSANTAPPEWEKQRAIEALLARAEVPSPLKTRLALVLRVRDFASARLSLPDNRSYRTYADIERPYLVWNVYAAPELSLELDKRCASDGQCVSYRSHVSETQAQSSAQHLRREGYDVYVAGVHAYSTLGRFTDPVLNTFVNYPATELAHLIFHELAHQVAYVPGDPVFNESFAETVAEEGLRLWLDEHGSMEEKRLHRENQERRRALAELFPRYGAQLVALYGSDSPEEAKRAGKKEIFQRLATEYARLKDSWSGYTGYDAWFERDLNNAQVAYRNTYRQLVPGFQALLAEHGGDLSSFYEAVKRLAALPSDMRLAHMSTLVATAAKPPGPEIWPPCTPAEAEASCNMWIGSQIKK